MKLSMLSFRTAFVCAVACVITFVPASPFARAQCTDWSASFGIPGQGINGTVNVVKSFQTPQGERLYAGGTFTLAGATAATNVAVWDGTSWSAVGSWPFGGTVRAFEMFDDGTGLSLYAGGSFQGATVKGLVKWDGSQWVDVGGTVAGEVYALQQHTLDGVPALIVAGRFTDVGGLPCESIAAWTSSGWKRWVAPPDFAHRMSTWHDPVRDRLVMVGNTGTGSGSCDTWEWDGINWARVSTSGPNKREVSSITYDSIRQRVLLMGGYGGALEPLNSLWAWNGSTWTNTGAPGGSMTARSEYGLAFDAARDHVVVFGGIGDNSARSNQTWEFDGTTWALRTPATSPAARYGAAMGYDPVRQRVVLFSGSGQNLAGDTETWEWDGTNWTLRNSAGPLPRTRAMLSFNPATNSMILAGGEAIQNDGISRDDIWSWDGNAWTQVATPSAGPSSGHARALDTVRQRIVAKSGSHVRPIGAGSWQAILRGGLSDSSSPGMVSSLAVFTDEGGTFLYAAGTFGFAAGQNAESIARLENGVWMRAGARTRRDAVLTLVPSGPHAGLWANGDFRTTITLHRWIAGDWQPYTTADGTRFSGNLFSIDMGQGPMLGGVGSVTPGAVLFNSSSLFALDSQGWKPVGFREPSARTLAAMAYDPIRRQSVMFGGTSNLLASGALSDTELFNGKTWTTQAVAGPSARFEHAMAFDDARGQVVLVGGIDAAGATNGQTWTWDGSAWTLAAASIGGNARSGHALAYDPVRQRVVLFGGKDANGVVSGETWEWDGSAWSQVSTSGPAPRDRHAMIFDPTRGTVLLASGRNSSGITLNDAWSWDGTQWALINSAAGGSALSRLVFDKVDNRVEMYTQNSVSTLSASNQWTSAGSGFGLGDVQGRVVVYDTAQNTPVIFGGHFFNGSSNLFYPDTRVYRQDYESALVLMGTCGSYSTFGSGTSRRHFFATPLGDQSSLGVSVLGDSCSAPSFSQQPVNQTAVYNSSVTFTATAVGTQPVAYQWRRNGVPISNVAGSISGAQSKTLQFGTAWNYSNAGTYDCVATSPFGQAISQPAQFNVENTGPSGPVLLTKIVYPPEPLQGEPGVILSSFSPAWIANSGRISFSASSNAGSLLAGWKSGITSQIARTSQNAPEVETSSVFDQLTPLDMSSSTGGVLYSGRLAGDLEAGYAYGLWFNDELASNLIARQGLEASGTDAVFQSAFTATINATGTIVFRGSLVGGSALPETSTGIWTWQRGMGQTLQARTGDIAPGGTLPFTHFDQFSCADDEALTLYARVNGVSGLWSGPPGSVTRRALQGELAPGLSPPATILSLDSPFTRGVDGVLYFVARTQNSPNLHEVLYISTSEGASPILRSGVPVPGQETGTTFTRFFPISSNASGDLLFQATASCTSCGSLSGMFLRRASGEVITLLFGPGTPPPGVSAFFTSATPGTLGGMTELGQIVFSGTVSNGPVNGPAVFGWTPSSGTFSILAPGHQIAIAPGVYRTVTGATIINGNLVASGSNLSKSLNPLGQVVIRVAFSDNTSGLFRGTFGQFLTAVFDCPTFAVPIADTTERAGRTASLNAEVAGAGPFTFQWFKDGQPLSNSARFAGTDTTALSINSLELADSGVYSLEVSNACQNPVSAFATLTVLCPSDLDNDGDISNGLTPDGAVDINDLLSFIVGFEAGTVQVDLDEDGVMPPSPDQAVDINDLLFFLSRFEAGC